MNKAYIKNTIYNSSLANESAQVNQINLSELSSIILDEVARDLNNNEDFYLFLQGLDTLTLAAPALYSCEEMDDKFYTGADYYLWIAEDTFLPMDDPMETMLNNPEHRMDIEQAIEQLLKTFGGDYRALYFGLLDMPEEHQNFQVFLPAPDRIIMTKEDTSWVNENLEVKEKNKMIIDLILDRKDDVQNGIDAYDPEDFYREVVAYEDTLGLEQAISRALDSGTEEDVKAALKQYIDDQNYNEDIKVFIDSVLWLDDEFDNVNEAIDDLAAKPITYEKLMEIAFNLFEKMVEEDMDYNNNARVELAETIAAWVELDLEDIKSIFDVESPDDDDDDDDDYEEYEAELDVEGIEESLKPRRFYSAMEANTGKNKYDFTRVKNHKQIVKFFDTYKENKELIDKTTFDAYANFGDFILIAGDSVKPAIAFTYGKNQPLLVYDLKDRKVEVKGQLKRELEDFLGY